ncbi:MAG: NnrS family protein [Thioalkalispiraceae bacterium]
MIQITEPAKKVDKRLVPFALGFRPFFSLAGIAAVVLLGYWLIVFSRGLQVSEHLPAVYWHSHEMVFGYSAAVIAGFLLTAVRNWTSIMTLNGKPLLLLVLVWLLARILPFTSAELLWFSVVDMLFLPLLAVAIAYPLLKVKQWQNIIFVGLLLVYALANGLFHAELLFNLEGGEETGIHAGLAVVIMIITIMAGRVVGFFIERGIGDKVKRYPLAEQLAIWGSALFMLGQFYPLENLLTVISILAAIGHLARLAGWYHRQIWQAPLLWVLYVGYAWLCLGFILTGLELNKVIAETLAIHAFTTGAIGVITIGMMARVTTGHTGREMKIHPVMSLGFVLINLAVVVRVFLPMLLAEHYLLWIQLSGILWVLGFLLFVLVYLPMLLRPRVDGLPG